MNAAPVGTETIWFGVIPAVHTDLSDLGHVNRTIWFDKMNFHVI